MSNPAPSIQKTLWGILTRRERWGLSQCGLLAIVLLFGLACLTLFLGIYPFLAVTRRVNCNILVVEGWVHDSTPSVCRRGRVQNRLLSAGIFDWRTHAGIRRIHQRLQHFRPVSAPIRSQEGRSAERTRPNGSIADHGSRPNLPCRGRFKRLVSPKRDVRARHQCRDRGCPRAPDRRLAF